jgi:rhomboid protease GluP
MASDGDIDFRLYTREQLDNAVTRIDHDRYPINAQNLTAEYRRRRTAESQAVVLAEKSGSAVIPDLMLSVPKTFAVTFEPGGNFSRWLGASRNDFHLVGSGTVQVVGEIVRLTGRRFSILMGVPLRQTEELARQFVVNIESDGAVVRFELRVPGEKTQAITLWLRSVSDTEELTKSLPIERTSDFIPQLLGHVEFERRLIAQLPVPRVTYALIITNVCIYVTTAIGTNHFFGFDGQSLLPLGSNFGPYTTAGDWWRLVTAMFLHLGVFHLAFNMWALASFGPMVERLYGSLGYLLIYLVAGLAGGLASVTWQPAVNSIGASGAIFGVLGALVAVQLHNEGSIPKNILRPIRNSSLIFTGCALVAGLLGTGVDNAAHMGGLGGGLFLGITLARPVTGQPLIGLQLLRRVAPAVVVAVALLGVGLWCAKGAAARLTGEAAYFHELHWFVPREAASLERWRESGALYKAKKWDDDTYANWLEREVVPFWREADTRFGKVALEPKSSSYGNLQLLQMCTISSVGDHPVSSVEDHLIS